jgi:hypothetical protein
MDVGSSVFTQNFRRGEGLLAYDPGLSNDGWHGRRPTRRYSAPELLAGSVFAIKTLCAAPVRIDSKARADSPKHAPLSVRRSSALHRPLINPSSEWGPNPKSKCTISWAIALPRIWGRSIPGLRIDNARSKNSAALPPDVDHIAIPRAFGLASGNALDSSRIVRSAGVSGDSHLAGWAGAAQLSQLNRTGTPESSRLASAAPASRSHGDTSTRLYMRTMS